MVFLVKGDPVPLKRPNSLPSQNWSQIQQKYKVFFCMFVVERQFLSSFLMKTLNNIYRCNFGRRSRFCGSNGSKMNTNSYIFALNGIYDRRRNQKRIHSRDPNSEEPRYNVSSPPTETSGEAVGCLVRWMHSRGEENPAGGDSTPHGQSRVSPILGFRL